MHISIIVFNGMDELDALAPYEVLSHGINKGAPFTLDYVCSDAPCMITGNHGLKIQVDKPLDQSRQPDLLVVPGGGWNDHTPRGVRHEVERGTLLSILKNAHKNGTILASVCTGAMLLAHAGLLQDRPAVTFHGALNDLAKSGAHIKQARVVDDGDIITAAGVTSGMELGLWLIERFASVKIASAVESHIEYERRGIVWRNG